MATLARLSIWCSKSATPSEIATKAKLQFAEAWLLGVVRRLARTADDVHARTTGLADERLRQRALEQFPPA
jgi:hypothetical protein